MKPKEAEKRPALDELNLETKKKQIIKEKEIEPPSVQMKPMKPRKQVQKIVVDDDDTPNEEYYAKLSKEDNDNYATWLPPQDQTGDGRTKLNEKFGY